MPPPTTARPLLEIAVDDVEGARAAAAAGADRLELCAALSEDGLTPSRGLLAAVKAELAVPVFAMIRPRGGDFVYSAREFDVMRRDIDACREAGADGLVCGALTRDRDVDGAALRPLLAAAQGLPVTFHRAFDGARDQARALADLIDLGCARVLTSGGAPTAVEGAARLRALVAQAGPRIVIVAGGSVRAASVAGVLATGVREVHAGPRRRGDAHLTTDAGEVRALVETLARRQAGSPQP